MPEMPDHVKMILEEVGPLDIDEVMGDSDIVKLYSRGQAPEFLRDGLEKNVRLIENRQCILCERSVEHCPSAVVVVHGLGVEALFCSGTCSTEFAVLSWMTMFYDGMVQDVAMRSEVPINPDEQQPDN